MWCNMGSNKAKVEKRPRILACPFVSFGTSWCYSCQRSFLQTSENQINKNSFQTAAKSSVSFLLSALSQLAGRPSRLEGGLVSHPDLDDPPTPPPNLPPPSWLKGPWLTRFGPNLWMGGTSCRVCVYACVHGDGRPLPLYSRGPRATNIGAERRGDWPGRPVGELLLLGSLGQRPGVFNIAWEKSKLKRIVRKRRPTSHHFQSWRIRQAYVERDVGIGGLSLDDPQIRFLGPVGELALVTLGNRMGHCMGLRMGYSMSTVPNFFWLYLRMSNQSAGLVFVFLIVCWFDCFGFFAHAGCRSRRTRSESFATSWSS